MSMFEVTDDSGFLALIDPDAYVGFVDEEWGLEKLMAHFRSQMADRHLLVWGTGLEGWWRVRVSTEGSAAGAFREITGPITVARGRLLLTNYESLTMAAGYADVTLPEAHARDLLVEVPPGDYTCRVLQMFDPETQSAAEGDGPDFVIELRGTGESLAAWSGIPWSDF